MNEKQSILKGIEYIMTYCLNEGLCRKVTGSVICAADDLCCHYNKDSTSYTVCDCRLFPIRDRFLCGGVCLHDRKHSSTSKEERENPEHLLLQTNSSLLDFFSRLVSKIRFFKKHLKIVRIPDFRQVV